MQTTLSEPPTPTRTPHPGRPLRVAVIGCGAIAKSMHLPVLAGHEGVELAALVDRDRERAAELAAGYKVPAVLADAAELGPDRIDAAVVATPPFHHAACTIDLLRRGVHVLVEKPMATTLADAEEMVRVAGETGRALAVGFFRRFNPSLRLLKALLESGWPGRPRRFEVEGGGMYYWSAATLGNMRRDLAGGGVLIDFGSHMLDLLFALFGEPAEVLDYRDNALGGVEADCSIRLRLRHGGDPVEGTVELARTRELGNFIRVECERATLEFQVGERHRVRVTPHGLALADPVTGGDRPWWMEAGWAGCDEGESWYETFRAQIDDWLGAIRAGREPVLSGRSALPTVRLIEECYRNRRPMAEPWVWAGVGGEAPEGGERRAAPAGVFAGAGVPAPKRVLVTGASGFIGARVAEVLRLREGCEVRAAVHNPGNASRLARLDVEMVQGSLESDADVERMVRGCDAVIHCAIGTDWGSRRKIFAVTAGGTRRLAEAALAAGVGRFVHLSTISVFGDDGALTGTLDEGTPVRPARGSDYGESKAAAERAVLRAAERGLTAVVLRPARVFGPFSRIFVTRPVQAIARGCFRWIGDPDVPADLVYVDNLVEAILRCAAAPAEKVRGEAFNISDGDPMTWREFYAYFAAALGLDLDKVPSRPKGAARGPNAVVRAVKFPLSLFRGVRQIVTSAEFKSLGRRVLQTDPVGALPRWMLGRFPPLERAARRLVGADNAPPVYRRGEPAAGEFVEMGSAGALVCIDKARRLLGYEPVVPRPEAMQHTLEWIRHARLV